MSWRNTNGRVGIGTRDSRTVPQPCANHDTDHLGPGKWGPLCEFWAKQGDPGSIRGLKGSTLPKLQPIGCSASLYQQRREGVVGRLGRPLSRTLALHRVEALKSN